MTQTKNAMTQMWVMNNRLGTTALNYSVHIILNYSFLILFIFGKHTNY